jgi:hypothetical protein
MRIVSNGVALKMIPTSSMPGHVGTTVSA